MKLYEIQATDWQTVVPEGHTLFNIGQKPDCSAFLVLSPTDMPLPEITTIPAGYDFTYRQAWGLTTNRESVSLAISEIRDELIGSGFTFGGSTYHCDHVFQSQVQALLQAWQIGLLPPDGTVAIRRKDNTIVQMDKAQLTALASALLAHVQSIYAASWAAKDALQ